jgi:integrase
MDGKLLSSVALRLFCGMRTEEIVRCDWHDVRWQETKPFVHIGEDKAKGRAARNVTIPPNALEWLALCTEKKGPISPRKDSVGYCKAFRRLRRKAELDTKDPKTGKWVSMWETNDTRHSFGSYHYAAHGDAILTSREMGHKQGDTMLFSHYRQLTTEAEGLRYFALVPQPAIAEHLPFEPIAKLA